MRSILLPELSIQRHCFSTLIQLGNIYPPPAASSLACDGKEPPFQKAAATAVVKSLGIVQGSSQLADIKARSVALTLND